MSTDLPSQIRDYVQFYVSTLPSVELSDFLTEQPGARPGPPLRPSPKRPLPAWVYAVAAVVILVGVGGVVLLVSLFGEQAPPVVTEPEPSTTVVSQPEPSTTVTSSAPPAMSTSIIHAASDGGLTFVGDVVLDPENLPVIGYSELFLGNAGRLTGGSVWLARCSDRACSGQPQRVALAPDMANRASVALLPDDQPVVAYAFFTGLLPQLPQGEPQKQKLWVAGPGGATVIEEAAQLWATGRLIAVSRLGLPVVAYFVRVGTSDELVVLACGAPDCSTDNRRRVIHEGRVGPLDLAVDAQGLPVLVYEGFDGSPFTRLARCSDPTCTGEVTITTISEGAGGWPRLAVGADDLPVVLVWGWPAAIIACHDRSCESRTVTELSSEIGQIDTLQLALGPDGIPVISWYESDRISVAVCEDRECTRMTVTHLPFEASPGHAMAIGDDGALTLVYKAGAGGDVVLIRCVAPACTTSPPPTGVSFEVLATGTEVGFMGRVAYATDQQALDEAWRFFHLSGPPPHVDFEASFVLFYAVAEDACPDVLEELVIVGGRLVPGFVPPSGFCEQPLIPTSYAVAVERSTVPDRFIAVLPGWEPQFESGYADVEVFVDLTSSSDLPPARPVDSVVQLAVFPGGTPGVAQLVPPEYFGEVWSDSGLPGDAPILPKGHVPLMLMVACHQTPQVARAETWGPYLVVTVSTAQEAPCIGGDPYTIVAALAEEELGSVNQVEIVTSG